MADALHDTTWVLTAPVDAPDGVEVTIAFSDGNVSGYAGCNRFTGTYTYDDGQLTFGTLASTRRACPDEVMAIEHDVLRRLSLVSRANRRAEMLTLADDDAVLLEFQAQTEAGLEGDWMVNGIHYPEREAIISVRGDLSVTIREGRISGHSGCNRFAGGFTVTDDAVTIGPLMGTRMFCDDPDAGSGPSIMEQEAALLAAFEHTASYRLEGSRLTLVRPDGGIAVSLHRV
jgi:heat shock protein HslJ